MIFTKYISCTGSTNLLCHLILWIGFSCNSFLCSSQSKLEVILSLESGEGLPASALCWGLDCYTLVTPSKTRILFKDQQTVKVAQKLHGVDTPVMSPVITGQVQIISSEPPPIHMIKDGFVHIQFTLCYDSPVLLISWQSEGFPYHPLHAIKIL